MLAEEIWQIAEGFVEVPVNLLAQMINNVGNFVEETLIISTMWKATWEIFHKKVSTI